MARVNAIPPPITGDVYRFSVWTRQQGQVCINSFEVMGDAFAATPATNMNSLLTAWVLGNEALYLLCMTSMATLFRYTLQCISSNAFATIEQAPSKPGTALGSPLPLEMAAIIRKTGPFKGQHGRGRVFMPGIPVSFTTPATNPNLLNATGILAYQNLATSIVSPDVVGGITYKSCVSTRPIPPALVVTTAADTPVMTPVALLGTVRRRREGRGI